MVHLRISYFVSIIVHVLEFSEQVNWVDSIKSGAGINEQGSCMAVCPPDN